VKARRIRSMIADTLALVLFSTALGAFVEIVVSGLTVEQSMRVRIAAVPVSALAGRPYGLYRDWLFQRLKLLGAGRLRAAALDSVANLTFQVPLYVMLLWFSGAAPFQIVTAAGFVFAISLVSGRPYGLFLTWCRQVARVREAA
jgi:hypothetical protein